MRDLQLPVQPRLLADSFHKTRLTSYLVPIPTCLLAEMRTHRTLRWGDDEDFSINANSDRAIPIKNKIEMVKAFPYLPIPSLANKGMTAIEEMTDSQVEEFDRTWLEAMASALYQTERILAMGGSKQYANRLLMPFSWSLVVLTGVEAAWRGFFKLRVAPDVEPNFRFIAKLLQDSYLASTPKILNEGDWHIAFSEEAEDVYFPDNGDRLHGMLNISASCSARISYAIDRDELLSKHKSRAKACFGGDHSSVFEHQAQASDTGLYAGNFGVGAGWMQLRKMLESGVINIF